MPDHLDIRDIRRAVALAPPSDIDGRSRRAAISAVLRQAGSDLEVLMIRRAIRTGDPWSGHMALPGGTEAPADGDLQRTAVRETLEEVGLDLESAGDYIGRLDDLVPARQSDISVRPFVFSIAGPAELSLNGEVQEALWVPLLPLLSGARRSSFELSRAGQTFRLPAWDIGGRLVWGLTYRVLDGLLGRLVLNVDSAGEKR